MRLSSSPCGNIIFFLLITAAVGCQKAGQGDEFAALDRALTIWEHYGFSGGLMIEKKGEIRYQKGFGFADHETAQKNTVNTRFDLGSVTKHLTAAAILKLEQENQLQLSDQLGQYLTLDSIKSRITLQQLLNHTSGLEKDPSYAADETFSLQKDIPLILENTQLKFLPGARFIYSNLGYCVLALVIEKVTGEGYQSFIRKQFFEPLNMTRSSFYDPGKTDSISFGYERTDFGVERVDPYAYTSIPLWLGGASGVVTTFEDMNQWFNALFGGRVIDQGQLKKLLTPVGVAAQNKSPYANGLRVVRQEKDTLIFHDGDTQGHEIKMMYYPRSGYRFLFYVNNRDRWKNVVEKLIENHLEGKEPEPLPSPSDQSIVDLPDGIKNENYEIMQVEGQHYIVALTQEGLFGLTDLELKVERTTRLNLLAEALGRSLLQKDTVAFRQFVNKRIYSAEKRMEEVLASFTRPDYDSLEVLGTATWRPGLHQTFIKFSRGEQYQVLRFVWHPKKEEFLFFGGGKEQLAVRKLVHDKGSAFYTYHPKDRYMRKVTLTGSDIMVQQYSTRSLR